MQNPSTHEPEPCSDLLVNTQRSCLTLTRSKKRAETRDRSLLDLSMKKNVSVKNNRNILDLKNNQKIKII